MAFDVSEDCVAKAEAALGARLPDAYRRHMMRCNGGELAVGDDDWQLHPVFDDTDRRRAARTCNDIVRETAACAGWSRFPPAPQLWRHETGELVPLADDFDALARRSDQ
jgi:hypothetical protein